MIVLRGIVGSHAYGCATEESDYDYMQVGVKTIDSYFGINSLGRSTQSVTTTVDTTTYELLTFVSYCVKFNPNVVPLLFLQEHEYEVVVPAVRPLLENKNLFLSNAAFNSLRGYAMRQQEKAKNYTTGDMGAKRKAIVEAMGYDVKAASHTVRLLMLGNDLCETGSLMLKGASNLCSDIRAGRYSFNEYLFMVKELEADFVSAYESSELKYRTVDLEKVNEICVNCLEEIFYGV